MGERAAAVTVLGRGVPVVGIPPRAPLLPARALLQPPGTPFPAPAVLRRNRSAAHELRETPLAVVRPQPRAPHRLEEARGIGLLTTRGESTPHEPQDVVRAESGGLGGCGALSPRAGGANRCTIRSTVSCGEGKPLPTPHGATRREWMPSGFHHRLLAVEGPVAVKMQPPAGTPTAQMVPAARERRPPVGTRGSARPALMTPSAADVSAAPPCHAGGVNGPTRSCGFLPVGVRPAVAEWVSWPKES